MAPGRRFPLASRVARVKERGEGALNLEAPRTGLGFILQHMLGSDAPTSVQQSASAAWLQTFTPGGTTKSFTCQTGIQKVDVPTLVQPFTAAGCMITGWTISVETGGFVVVNCTVLAREVDTAPTLATANYSTATQVYSWEHCSLKIDTVAVPLVNGFTLTAGWNMESDRYHLGGAGFMSQPRNVFGDTLSGSFNADFSALTNWYDRFHDNTTVALEFKAEADIIASTFKQALTVSLPAVKLRGNTPMLSNELSKVDVPYEVYTPASGAPVTITYMSTDTTI